MKLAEEKGASASGQIVLIHLGEVHVKEPTGQVTPCRVKGALKNRASRREVHAVAVGDFVRFRREKDGTGLIEEVKPRRSFLGRSDPRRVLAANIDQMVIVVSLQKPRYKLGLIDRYLVAANVGHVPPVLVVNKTDLGPERGIEHLREVYGGLDLPVIPVSAATGEGLDQFKKHLEGRLTVLVGHSGVGKSSLINALNPVLDLPVGEVSGSTEKGRHTTTWIRLIEVLPGTRIIDSAGIREFKPSDLKIDDLVYHFPEMIAFIDRCRFRNCTHRKEEGCAVRDAVERGEISQARFLSYQRIFDELNATDARLNPGTGNPY
jgi:ribosome biogenesis GTPase